MCQVNEEDLEVVLKQKLDLKSFRKCLKCDENSVIVTRINEALCRSCFIEYFTHKFRATIGKNKIFEKDERVLFPYSGSLSSVAMLDLIAKGAGEEAKKKFTFVPTILFIEDSSCLVERDADERLKFMREISETIESLSAKKFRVIYSLLESSLINDNSDTEDEIFHESIDSLRFDEKRYGELLDLLNSIGNQTSKEEMIKRLRNQLINRIAVSLKIEKIIFAVNCTKLTIDLISNIALGKGAHLSAEAALEEKRSDNLIYLRPLRELTAKECAFYDYFSENIDAIKIINNNNKQLQLANSTIYRLAEKFINSLQNEYPTTVATIFRTSDKLTPIDELKTDDLCCLCECPIDTRLNPELLNTVGFSSALNDLAFSKHFVTDSQQKSKSSTTSSADDVDVDEVNNNNNISSVENLFKRLCYSCSIIVNDLNDKEKLPSKFSRESMRNEIKEFLLTDDE